MEFVLYFLVLFDACAGEIYWQLQLSPESIVVPYGGSHISVWEHATRKGRYFAIPVVCLQAETARSIHNVFTGRAELEFDVLLWSREAREIVHAFLTTHINASIVEEQVKLLPMERIRIVWKGDPLPDYYHLADQWRSNTHQPTVVTFSVTCQNNEKCEQLQTAIRTRPSTFKDLELEYETKASTNNATSYVTSNVQIMRHDSVQSIKVRVDCDVNQTSRLTPELFQARVERFINKTETEQNELAVVLQSEHRKLAGVLQDGLGRLAAALQTQISEHQAASETQNNKFEVALRMQIRLIETMAAGQQTMIGLQALDLITSDMRSLPKGYCYKPGYQCSVRARSATVGHISASRQELKTLCDEDAACQAFNDYTGRSLGGHIHRQIFCPPASFGSYSRDDRYYVKIAATFAYVMKRKVSDIASTIQSLVVSRSQSVHDEYCKRWFGDEYQYEN